jgi:hypothetical protein
MAMTSEIIMKSNVFLVKFDRGYYAEKQPEYKWSYTNDPMLAKRYKTKKLAQGRASWGLGLVLDACSSAEIEEHELTIVTTMKKIDI